MSWQRNRAVWGMMLCLVLSACVDVRSFEGRWRGAIIAEPAVRQGFAEDAEVEALELTNVAVEKASAILTTSDGRFSNTRLTRITKTAGDALASLTFDGDSLRSYFFFAPVSDGGGPALMLITLFYDEHLELRVIRGNDLFGVFHLRRD